MTHYDLIVIGSGPAGEKGAAQAAYFGKRVAIVEQAPEVGGTGINTGTIPSKTLRETALYFSGLHQRGLYGVDHRVAKDLTVNDFLYREREVVRSLGSLVLQNIERHHIDLVHGRASFEDPHTIRVQRGERQQDLLLHADVILIATGSVPSRPRNVSFDDPRLYDSDTILRMDQMPRSIAVVGAGVIGCEYTTIFGALGLEVTLIDGRDRLLGFLDGEISERLKQHMEALDVSVRLGEEVTQVQPRPDALYATLRSGVTLSVDCVLFAAGRAGNTTSLGLEKVGIPVNDRGLIAVNERYQTLVSHIYAAGDVIGFPALAATSMEQARVAMVHAFDLKYKARVAPLFPLAVYSIPEVAMVGETEESCRGKSVDYCVGRASYRQNARGQIAGDLNGLVKLVFRREDKKLLGVHIIGLAASELVHIGLMVLQTGGTIDTFIDSVFNYPTVGETYKYAAYDGLGQLAARDRQPR
jgi:NAD(P) transhydrogenase